MFFNRLSFVLLLSLVQLSVCYSQQSSKEEDYTILYENPSTIQLQFDENKINPTVLSVVDVATHRNVEISFQGRNTVYTLNNLYPSEIIEVDYTFGSDATVHRGFIANASLSTGTINVYFNHQVDTSYAQIQNAVNLGNTLDDKLITYINACTTTMDIAIYNSYSPSATTGIAGAINAAYARGVQIRVIYDGSTTSAMLPLLNSNIPTLASPTDTAYGIMHNKFVIFDANVSDANKPVVWTGSTNWTVSQIDGPDRNSAIVIQDQALALGYKIEFEEMWGSSTMTPDTTLSKFGPDKTNNTPHTYNIGGKVVNSYFSPSDGTNARIIASINSANSDINVATMVETRTDIANALINKYNSGLTNTNIVIDSQNPTGNQITNLQSSLAANHAVVYSGSGIMHHKFMVVDNYNSTSDPLVLVGSHNWSSAAENKNDENILIVHDLNIANQYYQAFAYLYQFAGGVLGVNQNQYTDNFVVYPNPCSGVLNIDATGNTVLSNADVTVYDVLGNKVYDNHYSNLSHQTIDLSSYASGMYLINVQENDKTGHFKVLKQ
ncbi:MAG TPA: phospholipase D-like domain-containing protein [Flavobacterium sp.]|uniref:phospholipase D-like domain-containing protein n=1 Tax=Flavobacterium sp. TaxID=239 RepID=UPI002C0EAB19|nr:phospholipase D-like domain-containing protein [Flavobacterium sp.]HNP33966.1 phospholipase D-like domain-containing protein [Flavobacterium sp.]